MCECHGMPTTREMWNRLHTQRDLLGSSGAINPSSVRTAAISSLCVSGLHFFTGNNFSIGSLHTCLLLTKAKPPGKTGAAMVESQKSMLVPMAWLLLAQTSCSVVHHKPWPEDLKSVTAPEQMDLPVVHPLFMPLGVPGGNWAWRTAVMSCVSLFNILVFIWEDAVRQAQQFK